MKFCEYGPGILALIANVRLARKKFPGTNVLAYFSIVDVERESRNIDPRFTKIQNQTSSYQLTDLLCKSNLSLGLKSYLTLGYKSDPTLVYE
jgi:hypothetical protein